jgi:bla regulator protein blaR1
VKYAGVAALVLAAAIAGPVMLAAQLPVPPGPPVDPNAQFDAASIKAFNDAGSGPIRMMIMPGRVEANGVPLRLLLRQALRVQDYQIIGVPDWANNERYTVVAKMPENASPNASPVMMTNLLKDRFKLVTHTETRELPIFNLVVARQDGRLGAGLKPTSAECLTEMQARRGGPPPPGAGPGGPGRGAGAPLPPPDFNQPAACGMMRAGPGLANASGQPIAQIAQLLSQFTGRPVYDKTNLAGSYDFDLKWAPDTAAANNPFGPPPPGGPVAAADPNAPNIYTAVQEQLGLKLDSARGPVEVIVIDRLERPTLD